MRILLAEDEPDLNRLILDKLRGEHYSVDSCMDGQAALDYLAAAEYDAVILDIMIARKCRCLKLFGQQFYLLI